MKVAIVCIAPLQSGAVLGGTYSAVLGEGLHEDGTDVELWTRREREPLAPLNVPVRQVWRPGPWAWLDILKEVRKRRPDVVHVQHYFFLLGSGSAGEISALLLLLGLFVLRKKTVITLHDVPGKEQITGEYVRLHRYAYPAFFVRAGLAALFFVMGAVGSKLIVHSQLFSERLAAFGVDPGKIVVIAHMPLPSNPMDRDEARRMTHMDADAPTVLFFGFATGYKGIENLIGAFEVLARRGSPIRLELGAGVHPKMGETADYQEYYGALRARAQALPNVRFVGFIEPALLDAYISAADVGILPYVEYHGASGPLFYYLSHDRAVLVSRAIARNTEGLRTGVFENSAESMADVIEAYFNDVQVHKHVGLECAALRVATFSQDYVHVTRSLYGSAA